MKIDFYQPRIMHSVTYILKETLLNRQLLKNDAHLKKTNKSMKSKVAGRLALNYKRIIIFWHKDIYCTLAFTHGTVTLLTPSPCIVIQRLYINVTAQYPRSCFITNEFFVSLLKSVSAAKCESWWEKEDGCNTNDVSNSYIYLCQPQQQPLVRKSPGGKDFLLLLWKNPIQ